MNSSNPLAEQNVLHLELIPDVSICSNLHVFQEGMELCHFLTAVLF